MCTLENNQTKPMFHIDFHGKYTYGEGWIEAGCTSLKNYFSGQSDQKKIVDPLKRAFFKKMTAAYEDTYPAGVEVEVDVDPEYLQGFQGWNIHTMTSQNCKLGIPSIQLELPPQIRHHLANSPEMITRWAKVIVEIYNEVIVPNWQSKQIKTTMQPSLADKVETQDLTNMQLQQLEKDFLKWDNSLWVPKITST